MGSYKERLIRFYQHYAPEKVSQVDEALKAYAGREDAMFRALEKKYGPEPHALPSNPNSGRKSASPGGEDHKARLTRFYQKYAPEKVAQVDAALKAYAGKEEAMFNALVKKYGPEPPASSGGDSDHKSRLVRFYQKYAPEKVAQVDAALKAYAGKEEAMFAALVKKYGPEPPASGGGNSPRGDDPKSRLIRFYQKYAPEKVSQVDAALKAYAGKEDAMFAALVKKYGPEPPAPSTNSALDTPRARLTRFYQKYAPEKVAQVDAALKAYAGKEEAMFNALVKKYGPEPPASSAAASPAPDTPRARLTRFYQKYAPEKVAQVDAALKAYAGKEDAMFAALVKKYGPEPPAPTTTGAPPSDDYKSRLTRLLQKYSPGHLPQIPALLERFKGKEEEMMTQFIKKFGPEPPAPEGGGDGDTRSVPEKIEALLHKYDPGKVGLMPTLMAKYTGKEAELLDNLVKKYGPVPPPEGGQTTGDASQSAESGGVGTTSKREPSAATLALQGLIGTRGLEAWYRLNKVAEDPPAPPPPPPPAEGATASPPVEDPMIKIQQQRENLDRLALVLETATAESLHVELPPPLVQKDVAQAVAVAPLLPGNYSDERVTREALQSYPIPVTAADIEAFRLGYQIYTLRAQFAAYVERDIMSEEAEEATKIEQLRLNDLVRITQLDKERTVRLRHVYSHAMTLLPSVEAEHRGRLEHQEQVYRHGLLKWNNDKMAALVANTTPTVISALEERFDNWKALVSGNGPYADMSPGEAARTAEHRRFFSDIGSPSGAQTWAAPPPDPKARWLSPTASQRGKKAADSGATLNSTLLASPITVRSLMHTPGPAPNGRYYNMSPEHERIARVRQPEAKRALHQAQRSLKQSTLYKLNRPYPEGI